MPSLSMKPSSSFDGEPLPPLGDDMGADRKLARPKEGDGASHQKGGLGRFGPLNLLYLCR